MSSKTCATTVSLLSFFLAFAGPSLIAQQIRLTGNVTDSQSDGVSHALIYLLVDGVTISKAISGLDGSFTITAAHNAVPDRDYVLKVAASGFQSITKPITGPLVDGADIELRLEKLSSQYTNVTVTADVNDLDVLSPDPGEKVFVRQNLLDANPGRPGAPVSIPGYPIETASSGIKAPQYFAPGVAGDHGEPIAQYIAVGGYLVPNNLSANAHGNGYADPNIFIPEILESVEVNGGSYNVLQGNHSLNLAAIYRFRSHLNPFLTLTADYRDLDLVVGISPTPLSLLAIEASYGNGFLKRLEHRQQYKLNTQRIFELGPHRLTLFGIGYYGVSSIPGLIPILPENGNDSNFPNYGDTIDPRQKDQTHTALIAIHDAWRLSVAQQLQLSGFFRTYNLALYSGFGQGLIRQSEFRTVVGSSINYVNRIFSKASFLGGFDYNREAPRRDNLDRYDLPNPSNPNYYGPFMKVDSNNVTIVSFTPYGAASGTLYRYLRYYAGWRRDQIHIDNQNLLQIENSFNKWVGVNSPKATISFLPKYSWALPQISFSFGQAFFTVDPRIETGSSVKTLVARAHSYQLVASKTIGKADLKLTLGHVTSSAQLGKIDADTGLQENEGPSRLKFLTVAVRHRFSQGSILANFSKADARDLDTGEPTPEAPRTIFDVLANTQKLPFRLQARGEFEYVGTKPLGTGCEPDPGAQCTGTPVKEFRAAVVRPFQDGRWDVGVNMLFATGYTGQTTQSFYPSDVQEVVGVRIPSYASLNLTYHFGRSVAP